MAQSPGLESEALWKRVGLEELRAALLRITRLALEFEEALKALPPCDSCARASLLEKIEASGRELGGAAITVSSLADVLRQAQETAEAACKELGTCAPEACACPPGRCACNHAPHPAT